VRDARAVDAVISRHLVVELDPAGAGRLRRRPARPSWTCPKAGRFPLEGWWLPPGALGVEVRGGEALLLDLLRPKPGAESLPSIRFLLCRTWSSGPARKDEKSTAWYSLAPDQGQARLSSSCARALRVSRAGSAPHHFAAAVEAGVRWGVPRRPASRTKGREPSLGCSSADVVGAGALPACSCGAGHFAVEVEVAVRADETHSKHPARLGSVTAAGAREMQRGPSRWLGGSCRRRSRRPERQLGQPSSQFGG